MKILNDSHRVLSPRLLHACVRHALTGEPVFDLHRADVATPGDGRGFITRYWVVAVIPRV